MSTVVIAGATGYLGQFLVTEYLRRGDRVRALARRADRAPAALFDAEVVEAQATQPATLRGVMEGADLLVSSLGITRQRDGLTYREVDYRANVHLLEEAVRAGVSHVAYVHVLRAAEMAQVPLVAAKQAYVDRLRAASVSSTVICPSGFFSDMGDILEMARGGRVYLFGDGTPRLNPIHGADLACAAADAIDEGRELFEVGGPDVLTQNEVAEMAFRALGKPVKITHLPDWLRRATLAVLPWVTPRTVHGPARFFLSALAMDMVGECRGERHLADHFAAIAAE
ncbi:MAG: NAD(P)H-binding protein [Sandaracinaceae bacterium]